MARLTTVELHQRFKAALAERIVRADADAAEVLTLEAEDPLPPRLRVYLFNATNPPGGRSVAAPEHKIQLRVPGQARNQRGNFDFGDERSVIMAGYSEPDDVYVLWDASLHHDFAWSKNVQVKTSAVQEARDGNAIATRVRTVRLGQETIIVTPSGLLADAIEQRFAFAGAPAPPAHPPPPLGGGQPYVAPPRGAAAEHAEAIVFSVDPDLVDRGTTAHMDIQDHLAGALAAHGLEPMSPLPADPQFDLAWKQEGVAFVVEVKSLTEANEERQLRLGLGQLLSYVHLLNWEGIEMVRGVLAVERQPTAEYWSTLCAEHDVLLTWPEALEEHLFEDAP